MSKGPLHISELQLRMQIAQERLTRERIAVCEILPMGGAIDKQAYVDAYIRAEAFGLNAINKKLADLKFLPVRLDPRTEMLGEERVALKAWLAEEHDEWGESQPSSHHFGNDFMHAIARAALVFGWEDIRVARIASRVAKLFSDLSCVIGIMYFSAWLTDMRMEFVPLSNPDDLKQTAKEIAALVVDKPHGKVIAPAAEQGNPPKKRDGRKEPPSFLHLVHDASPEKPVQPH